MEGDNETVTDRHGLKMTKAVGKVQDQCSYPVHFLRLIQSLPS